MAQPDERGILEALKTVVDPDKGSDIVSLGMVSRRCRSPRKRRIFN